MKYYTVSHHPTSTSSRKKGGSQDGYTLIVLLCVTFLLCLTMILMFWISRQPTSTISDKSAPSSQRGETLISGWTVRQPPSESLEKQSRPAQ